MDMLLCVLYPGLKSEAIQQLEESNNSLQSTVETLEVKLHLVVPGYQFFIIFCVL
jgi:hypothetical protein